MDSNTDPTGRAKAAPPRPVVEARDQLFGERLLYGGCQGQRVWRDEAQIDQRHLGGSSERSIGVGFREQAEAAQHAAQSGGGLADSIICGSSLSGWPASM